MFTPRAAIGFIWGFMLCPIYLAYEARQPGILLAIVAAWTALVLTWKWMTRLEGDKNVDDAGDGPEAHA